MTAPADQAVDSSEAIPMFPTFVWKSQLKESVYRDLNSRLLAAIDSMRLVNEPVPVGKTWQTNQKLHRLAEFAELMEYFCSATRGVLDFQKVAYESFEITGCWANISARGASHKRHFHPNNFLSGVYYVQAGKGANTITFIDPRIQRLVIDPHTTSLDENNAGEVTLEVKEGLIVLFPAWLVHSVGASTSEQERVSISFNIMFRQYAETMCYPKWQPTAWPEAF